MPCCPSCGHKWNLAKNDGPMRKAIIALIEREARLTWTHRAMMKALGVKRGNKEYYNAINYLVLTKKLNRLRRSIFEVVK